MVRPDRSFLVRFYAADGEHRARITDVIASRSWTLPDAASAGVLEACLVRDDPDRLAPESEPSREPS
jgi:hypothetical protein